MKITLAIFMIIIKLFSIDFDMLKKYQNNGIDSIKREFDKELTKKSFWEEYLKNKSLKYGYIAKYRYLLISYKFNNHFEVIDLNSDKIIFKTTVLVGKNRISDKNKEGDLATPVGVYKLIGKKVKLSNFYGPFAYETNYPNEYDKLLDKNGYGIWIHGVPTDNTPRKPYTRGCIAMDNNSLNTLDKKINLSKSILLVYQKPFFTNLDEISTLFSELFSWKYAWEYNDIDSYLSFYNKDFKRLNGEDFKKFTKYKKRVFSKNSKKNIIFKDINIILYPNIENKKMFKIEFFEIFKTKNYKFRGSKILYVELKNNKMKIISEK